MTGWGNHFWEATTRDSVLTWGGNIMRTIVIA